MNDSETKEVSVKRKLKARSRHKYFFSPQRFSEKIIENPGEIEVVETIKEVQFQLEKTPLFVQVRHDMGRQKAELDLVDRKMNKIDLAYDEQRCKPSCFPGIRIATQRVRDIPRVRRMVNQ